MAKVEHFQLLFREFPEMMDRTAKELADRMSDYYLECFRSQRWDGSAWAPLSEPYAKQKSKDDYFGPTLVRTGDLENSILVGLIRGVSNASFKGGIKFEIDSDKASWHNNGEGKQPQRQFIGESKELESIMIQFIEEKLINYFK